MVIDRSVFPAILLDEPERADSRARPSIGKGRHRAGLNFGDCFSHALAKATSQPLLFEGDDFVHTDIAVASRRGHLAVRASRREEPRGTRLSF